MAVYQIPQFLDSGEKIFLSMNIRQFVYALGFGFVSFLIVQVTIALLPGIGWFAIVPAVPTILLGFYLSIGKYNSRDSEIYVLAMILYLLKPRKLVYKRVPDLYDITEKFSAITAINIAKSMDTRTKKGQTQEEIALAQQFRTGSSEQKAKIVLSLAQLLESNRANTQTAVSEKQSQLQRLKDLLEEQQAKKGGNALGKLQAGKSTSADTLLDREKENARNLLRQHNQNLFELADRKYGQDD